MAIHHSPPEECKYVLADSRVIYYPRLRRGLEQARLLARHYSPVPLGGSAGWAELGWKGGRGQRQALLQLRTGSVFATKAVPRQRVGVEQRLPPPWNQGLGGRPCLEEGRLVPRHAGHLVIWGCELITFVGAAAGGWQIVLVSLEPKRTLLPGRMFH